MSRRLDLLDNALVVRYSGLDAVVILRREVRIPYTAIRAVSVGLTDAPGALALKIGLSTPPFGTRQQGRFREHGRWSFLDVGDRERTVVLDLEGHEFRRIALTVDDPVGFAEKLRGRIDG
jgi:hypothetical protein